MNNLIKTLLFVIIITSFLLFSTCEAFIVDSEGPESISGDPEGSVRIESFESIDQSGYIYYSIHNTGEIDFTTSSFNIDLRIDQTPNDITDNAFRNAKTSVIVAQPIAKGETYYSNTDAVLIRVVDPIYEVITAVSTPGEPVFIPGDVEEDEVNISFSFINNNNRGTYYYIIDYNGGSSSDPTITNITFNINIRIYNPVENTNRNVLLTMIIGQSIPPNTIYYGESSIDLIEIRDPDLNYYEIINNAEIDSSSVNFVD